MFSKVGVCLTAESISKAYISMGTLQASSRRNVMSSQSSRVNWSDGQSHRSLLERCSEHAVCLLQFITFVFISFDFSIVQFGIV